MDSFDRFAIDVHQVFFALLAALFCLLGVRDIEDIREGLSREKRKTFAIVFGVSFLGLIYSFSESMNGAGMFFALEFAFFVIFGFVSPKYAASFFIFLLLTRPWEIYENQLMETMPRDYFYVVVLSLLGHKIGKKQFFFRLNLASLFTGLFAVWVLLSTFTSPNFPLAIQKYVEVFTKGIVVFYVVQNCFERPADLLAAKGALVLGILSVSFISAKNTFIGETQAIGEEAIKRLESIGLLGNSNDVAAILVLALPFCVFFFLRRGLARFIWPLSLFSGCAILTLIWLSQSRGALLSVIAAICAFLISKIKSKRALLGVCLLGAFMTLSAFGLLARKVSDLEGSTNNRIIYWQSGINMAIRNPLLGVGFWGFNDNMLGYASGGVAGSEGSKMTAHSSWIQVVAETGFVGLFFFAGLWVYGLRKSWEVRKTDPEYLCAVAGYGTAITFLSHGYQMYPYILLSLAVTQSFLNREHQKRSLDLSMSLKTNMEAA